MKHLIVCCDGTWNRADQSEGGVPTPTNVRIFHNLLAERAGDGHRQLVRYFSGVGADGGELSRLFDGGTGHGLSRNIMNAYLWLAENFGAGDLVSAVGFSRGAYTVRSLIGMLTTCGLIRVDGERNPWQRVQQVFGQGYVRRRPAAEWAAELDFHPGMRAPAGADERAELGRRVEFLGVWDTVGSLGIPDGLGLLSVFDDRAAHAFHDTRLNPGIRCARHALALDERRGPFAPTLWTDPAGHPLRDERVTQLWFPGCHSDVGGGYRETGLSDGALQWMIGEAGARTALRFTPQAGTIRGDALDVLHDSCVGVYADIAPEPRSTPRVRAGSGRVHPSAVARMRDSPCRQDPYRPSVELAVGATHGPFPVPAHLRWCETGLYLRPGRYQLTATGRWMDKDEVTGPDGAPDPSFVGRVAYGIGDVFGGVEHVLRTVGHHPNAQLRLSKRVDDAPWMRLVVVVANGGFDARGEQLPHQVESVGAAGTVEVEREGYLYAFANDAWSMYSNNRGSVAVTVRRTA